MLNKTLIFSLVFVFLLVVITPGALGATLEAGNEGNLNNDEWHTVAFSEDFSSTPYVFTTTQTTNGGEDPSSPHIRETSRSSFETQHCEWGGSDICDGHNEETNGWAALDPSYINNNVEGMEAGIISTPGGETEPHVSVSFAKSFSSTPLVFASIQSENGNNEALNVQVIDRTTSGATIEFCEQETDNGCDSHASEDVVWLAIDPSRASKQGILDWGTVQIDDSNWKSVSFGTSFSSSPVVIVTPQTENGGEEALYGEADNVNTGGAEVRYCESDGGDDCDNHATETVAWIAVEQGHHDFNSPPHSPSNPDPSDGETGVSTNPTLSVDVSDPDDDQMNVSFHKPWRYCRNISVSDGIDGYQYYLHITNTTHMDRDSIRIANASCNNGGSVVDHWTESWATDDSDIWFEGSGTDTNYALYYNNSLASDISDGKETFIAFNDSEILSDGDHDDSGTLITFSDVSNSMDSHVRYEYCYRANTNGEDASISTFFDSTEVDYNSFDNPSCPENGGSYNTRTFTENSETIDNEVRFDYKNGDWKVMIRNIRIRKYSSIEPTITLGNQQSAEPSSSLVDGVIDTDKNVDSGDRASVDWPGLSKGTTYRWYTVADDGLKKTRSPVWNFTTQIDADSVSVETQPQDTKAGETINGPPQANVTDEDGNPVSGVEVNVSETGGYEFDEGVTTNTTDSTGMATFHDLVIEEADTGYNLTFDAQGVSEDNTSQSFDINPSDADHIEIEPEFSVVTSPAPESYTATSYDQYDNEIGDVTPSTSWSIENGAGGSWDQDTGTYTSKNAGTWTVTGDYNGLIDTATLIVEYKYCTVRVCGPRSICDEVTVIC